LLYTGKWLLLADIEAAADLVLSGPWLKPAAVFALSYPVVPRLRDALANQLIITSASHHIS
jgi:hypothetical protein